MQSNTNNNNNNNPNNNNNNSSSDWHSNIWHRPSSSTTTASIGNILSSSSSLPTLPPVQSGSQSRYSTSSNHFYQPYSTLPRSSSSSSLLSNSSRTKPPTRPRLTTTLWEDESTLCYQVDNKGICVARRQDNDMINGTKLLNVAGMSRGKRDGILKNERGRIVVKVGAMHLKGVWIPFVRAKALASQFKIFDILHPIFSDDPASFLYPSHFHQMNNMNRFNNSSSSSTSTNTLQRYLPYHTSTEVPHNNAIYGIYHHQPQDLNYTQDHHYPTETFTGSSVQKRSDTEDGKYYLNEFAKKKKKKKKKLNMFPVCSKFDRQIHF
ncbi:transcription regulator HTH, apses-type DNA-binding domain-containing protein [Helicostylum pulchrum]|nr:transcription regulator HTH, apses-type DNA-binding domain-containing protein [Helicostylum pulchrum]